jgi:hypothetical protein
VHGRQGAVPNLGQLLELELRQTSNICSQNSAD